MSHKRHGRKTPYTEAGIGRVPCVRCGSRARFQWQACADSRLYRPLCEDCDIDLNRVVLEWAGDPDAKAKIARYAVEARR